MDTSNPVSQFFSVFGVVILAAGTAGAILMALLVWVERTWTARIRQRDFADINLRVAETQAEITGNYKRQKDDIARLDADYRQQLQRLSANYSEALRRKRDIYTQLATTMRLLVQSGNAADKRYLNDFLACYDVAYMWAAEPVIVALHEFSAALRDRNGIEELRQHCLTEMRKDSGFPETKVASQRVIGGEVDAAPNHL